MKRFVPLFLLVVALLLASQTRADDSKYVPAVAQILVNEAHTYTLSPTQKTSVETGQPLGLWGLAYPVAPDTPEAMARQFLSENVALLGLQSADLSDLQHRFTRDGLSGYVVRFDQYVGNVPVYLGEIAIHINNQNLVTYVANDYKLNTLNLNVVPLVSAETARLAVHDHLDVSGNIRYDMNELIVFSNATSSRLAHKVTVVADSPYGEWEALVDANTGEIFKLTDRYLYEDGTATVFDPDPITTSQGDYGGGLVDANDVDSPELTAQLVPVTLRDLTFDGDNYHLSGPKARIVDVEDPFTGLFSQNSSDFSFTRGDDAFEAVNVYYHIDDSMRYLNDTLGLDLVPYQYADGGVRFDPQGAEGADNSRYSLTAGDVSFGEGCVDDAEDSDVIHHELAHGIHDWATNGSLSNTIDGLSEGTGDYWAQSYNRRTNDLPPSHPYYNHVFRWDGHNECWNGRTTGYTGTPWPLIEGPIHTAGQIWSTCMMRIWDEIGARKTDIVLWEGLAMTTELSTQNDAANAVYQAARDLNYTDEELLAIHTILGDALTLNTRCGYLLPAYTPGEGTPTSISLSEADVVSGNQTLVVSLLFVGLLSVGLIVRDRRSA